MTAMSVNIEPIVSRIFDQLRLRGSVIAERRRIGLSFECIESAIHKLGLQIPLDLMELYTCCDGTSTSEGEIIGEIQFFPGFYWMSLKNALEVYRSVSKSDEWNHAWLPIFANGGGDFYIVICDKESQYFGEVVGFVLGEQEHFAEFQSVSSLFKTIALSFEGDAFFFSDGRLKADYGRMREIARQAQPGFIEHEI